MSDIIIYSIPGSPFGRAVLAALAEKGAGFRLVPVPPQELKAPVHLARHPFGRVPVIEHDGFMLYETQAILRYLDRVFANPSLTPADPRTAARMDQIMNIADWYLFNGTANVIAFQRIVGPKLMGLTPDEAAIAEAMPRGHVVVAALAQLLGDKAFLTGDALTLADLLVATQLDFLAMTPEWTALAGDKPALNAWLERMQARPSFEATTWQRVSEMAAAA
jgi:glutathione S-transferase